MTTDIIASMVVLEELQKTQPNVNDLFDALGIAQRRYFQLYKSENLSDEVFGKSIANLHEAYAILVKQ